jgi:hypothetical protein
MGRFWVDSGSWSVKGKKGGGNTRRMVYGMLCGLWVARSRARKYVIESNSLKTEMQSSRSIIRKESVVGVLSCEV